MNAPAVEPACGADLRWALAAVCAHHYLRSAPDVRSRPLGYVVKVGGLRAGCLFFGRAQSIRCYRGGLTYGSAADVDSGRAAYDRWEVLNLARVWLCPEFQRGGAICRPEAVPGFVDRSGTWRPALASTAIRLALARVGRDYLLAQPPCFLDQPYAIRAVLSYCDTRLHRGTVYRTAGFRLAGRNARGIETWLATAVAPLTTAEDAAVRRASRRDPRAQRVRGRRAPIADLWDVMVQL